MPKKFNVIVEKVNGNFVAKCVEVDVVSQGKTLLKALESVTEAIDLYLEKGKVKNKEIFLAQVEVGK